jgi:hypothetical protein
MKTMLWIARVVPPPPRVPPAIDAVLAAPATVSVIVRVPDAPEESTSTLAIAYVAITG